MKAIGFALQTVVHPDTKEESKRLAVSFDKPCTLRLWTRDESIEDTTAAIKADREAALARVMVLDGTFGAYCVLTHAVTLEEF